MEWNFFNLLQLILYNFYDLILQFLFSPFDYCCQIDFNKLNIHFVYPQYPRIWIIHINILVNSYFKIVVQLILKSWHYQQMKSSAIFSPLGIPSSKALIQQTTVRGSEINIHG